MLVQDQHQHLPFPPPLLIQNNQLCHVERSETSNNDKILTEILNFQP